MPDTVLISWIAQRNDPVDARHGDDGPTLTLLFHESSPYRDEVSEVVFLHREHGEDTIKELEAVERTEAEIRRRAPGLVLHREPWAAPDPTDHAGIYTFLAPKIRELRSRFAGRELVIHLSPGTGSMQTVWVLMSEAGLIGEPFTLVKSYRERERGGRPAIVPVEVGLESYYKAYLRSQPRQASTSEQALHWDPGDFCGDTLKALFRTARRFSAIKVPVLLLGERGTGKSTFASWIRANSPYRREELDDSWPAVTCGQYDAHTMRSELFGHKKGAFTGAHRDHEGELGRANGDTLFLDEIGDVSRGLQRLLIKALEDKQFQRLGEDTARKSDFRLLSATNLSDEELRERLDPDFLDRISPLTLTLPALREIPEELEWMWPRVFAEAGRRASAESSVPLLDAPLHARVVAALRTQALPGNLRDLFRVAYRTLAALEDRHEQVTPGEAVDYGLEILTADARQQRAATARAIARAFAAGRPLDPFIDLEEPVPLDTAAIHTEFNRYLGEELRRLGKARGVKPGELCDVSGKTLLNWANGEGKKSSKAGKKASTS